MDLYWGRRDHWWLVDPENHIIDPTASQFPALVSYHAWNSGDPVRTGRCMECGKDLFRKVLSLDFTVGEGPTYCDEPGSYIQGTFCSQKCEDVFVLDQSG